MQTNRKRKGKRGKRAGDTIDTPENTTDLGASFQENSVAIQQVTDMEELDTKYTQEKAQEITQSATEDISKKEGSTESENVGVYAVESTQSEVLGMEEASEMSMSKDGESSMISQSQLQRDLLETRNELILKTAEFEEVKERLAEKESVEASVRSSLQNELDKSKLQAAVIVELNQELEQIKDKCNDLELKLEQKVREHTLAISKLEEHGAEAFGLRTRLEALQTEKEQMSFGFHELECQISNLESALSQSSEERSQLVAELKSFNERSHEYEDRANATLERNRELEDSIRKLESLQETENNRVKELNVINERNLELVELVRELEYKLESEKSRIGYLEQEVETRSKEHSDMAFALSTQLENALRLGEEKEKGWQSEKEQMNFRAQDLGVRVSELESALGQSLALKCELESQVKELNDKCAIDRNRANFINERNLELEELVRELEFQLESEKSRINYLQQERETRSKEHSVKLLALSTQLENAMQVGAEKEKGWQIEKEQINCQAQQLAIKVSELESALAQSLALKCELESKVEQLHEKCTIDGNRATVINERNLELEELVRKLEFQLEFGKSRISYLEQEMETRSKEHSDKVFTLSTQLENAVELGVEKEKGWHIEKEQMNCRVQELALQKSEIESALSQSLALKSELESQVQELSNKCAMDENRARVINEHNLELEELIHKLEFQLESGKSRINCLEQEIEAESKKHSDVVFALSTQLENAVQLGAEKEKGWQIEKEEMNFRAQELTVRISELESALGQSLALKSELESQVQELHDRCTIDESRATVIKERNLELEELVHKLEFQLESANCRINYLEQEIETRSKEHSDKFLALSTQLENEVQVRVEQEKGWQVEKEQMNYRTQELAVKISDLESALGQSLALKSELESQVQELHERCTIDENRATVIKERNLELEELVHKLEFQLESGKSRINYLEQEIEKRSKEHSDKFLALSTQLENEVQVRVEQEKGWQVEKEQMNYRAQELAVKISDLESALGQSLALKSELESQVQELHERCTIDENRTTVIKEHNLELEELVHKLEFQLESGKSRINYLEQEIETRSKEHSDTVFTLSTQLENAVQLRVEQEKSWQIEREQLNCRAQELATKISELELALSQSLDLKCELESKLKELNDKYVAGETRANAINERNLELQELIRELEFQLESRKSRINYLEQEVDNLGQKTVEYYDRVCTMTTQLEAANSTMEDMRKKLQEGEWKSEELELVNQELKDQLSFIRLSYDDDVRKLNEQMNFQSEELMGKINQLEKISLEHKNRACMDQERIRELEDLLREQELLFETQKNRTKDLEKEVEILELKCWHAESMCKEHVDRVSRLTFEMETEKQLVVSLNAIIKDERRKSEEDIQDLRAMIRENENLIQVLRSELLVTQRKLEMAEIKEIEITKKLDSALVQLQEKKRSLKEAANRAKELESVNITLINDTGLKMQELAESLKNKEIEVNSLTETLHIREHQIKSCVEEADGLGEALSKELNRTESLVEKNTNLENKLGVLQEELDRANVEKEEAFSTIIQQNEVNRNLDEEFAKSQAKLIDLQEKLSLTLVEKQYAVDNLNTAMKAVEDMKQQLSSERQHFQTKIDSIMEENQILYEASRVDQSNMQTIKNELENLKHQATQSSALQMKVEELDEKLRVNESRFKMEIDSIMEEKQLLFEEIRVAKSEAHTIRNELERQLKECKNNNRTLKAELESLNLQATQNLTLQSRVKELHEQLRVNEFQYKKEMAIMMEEKELLREENIKAQNEVLTLRSEFEKQLREYKESKLELEKMMLKASQDCDIQTEVKEVEQLFEVENFNDSTPRLDVINAKVQQHEEELAVSSPTSAYTEQQELENDRGENKRRARKSPTTSAEGHSPIKNIRIALGVALVSAATAILVGKK